MENLLTYIGILILVLLIVSGSSVSNRLRGTGKLFSICDTKVFGKSVEVNFVGNHLYGLFIATTIYLISFNSLLAFTVLAGYILGESKGWGKWVGSLTRVEPFYKELLEYCYNDDEGKSFPFIHQVSNFFIKEKIDDTFDVMVKQYLRYCTLALTIRGMFWWSLVYLPIMLYGLIDVYEFSIIVILLGVSFPIACYLGKKFNYEKRFGIISFSVGWENQEIIYGAIQGIALAYVVIH